jgi:hypothetical protein
VAAGGLVLDRREVSVLGCPAEQARPVVGAAD